MTRAWPHLFKHTVIVLAGGLLQAGGARAQQLRVRVHDAEGRPIPRAEVEVLLVAWGDIRRVPIQTTGGVALVPLSNGWLKQQWPERYRDVANAFVYVHATGHASALSRPFEYAEPAVQPADTVRVAFSNVRAAVAGTGEGVLTLVLPPAGLRTLTFVDDAGKPAAGVLVQANMFWSDSNHCGALAGADSLIAAVTDAQGRLRVPDGDIDYALALLDRAWVFDELRTADSARTILKRRIATREARLALHHLASVNVELHVTEGETPAGGLELVARVADCPCGACSGSLGRTDAQGRLSLTGFHAEEYDEVKLVDAAGRVRWQGRATDWLPGGVIAIRLRSTP